MDSTKPSRPLLITGFEPFGPFRENPSWTAAAAVHRRLGGSVVSLRLPVDHHESRRRLIAALKEINPRGCLCMGLAPHDEFRLEAVARKPKEFAGLAGEARLWGTWPWGATEQVLHRHQVPYRRSSDAGEYVCESTYWSLLDFASADHPEMHAGFLHVPAVSSRFPAKTTTEIVFSVVSAYCAMYLGPSSAAHTTA